jgi:ribosomal protein L11 methyltransferase
MSVSADHEAVEAVSEILARACAGNVVIEPAFELVDEGLSARIDISRPQMVRGFLPALDRGKVDEAVRVAAERLGHLQAFGLRPIGDLRTRILHEDDWAEAWKEHFPVLKVGRRLVIRPTWREHHPAAGDIVIALDPGMAFGTGLHPTTRLCLAALESLAEEGRLDHARVLDVGCGSGILAIGASLLGAAEVVGVDTDPLAVEATRANAGRNGLAGRLTAHEGSLPVDGAPFDVVLANLIASVLIELADELAAAVKPVGRLLASGIFVDRAAEVESALQSAGFELVRRTDEGDWAALDLERR